MTLISGRYKGTEGVVDSAVLQRTADHLDEYATGFHVVLDTGLVVTVRRDNLNSINRITYRIPDTSIVWYHQDLDSSSFNLGKVLRFSLIYTA